MVGERRSARSVWQLEQAGREAAAAAHQYARYKLGAPGMPPPVALADAVTAEVSTQSRGDPRHAALGPGDFDRIVEPWLCSATPGRVMGFAGPNVGRVLSGVSLRRRRPRRRRRESRWWCHRVLVFV